MVILAVGLYRWDSEKIRRYEKLILAGLLGVAELMQMILTELIASFLYKHGNPASDGDLLASRRPLWEATLEA